MTAIAIPQATWPRLQHCRCGETVLRARHAGSGRPFTLDAIPVLPEGTCGACEGRGRLAFERSDVRMVPRAPGGAGYEPGDLYGYTVREVDDCPACEGTGRRGEPLSAEHVLVGPDGIGWPYDGHRSAWEAAHRRHRCT